MPHKETLLCDVMQCLTEVRSRIDPRHIAFDVRPEKKGGAVILRGFVHFPQQEKAILNSLRNLTRRRRWRIEIHSRLRILSDMPLRFARVRVPAANLRFEAKQDGEVGTQVFVGSYVLCYFSKRGYFYCAEPDGYLGYIRKVSVIEEGREEYLGWLNGARCRLLKGVKAGNLFLPAGAEFACTDGECIILLDGTRMRVNRKDLYFYDPRRPKKIGAILRTARSFLGVKYLWGGKTTDGIDCSGFAQMVFLLNNIVLPRDAYQQANVGRLVGILGDFTDVLPGDLLFFMGGESRIMHVGISLGGERLIHATLEEGIKESNITDPDITGKLFKDLYIMGRRVLV